MILTPVYDRGTGESTKYSNFSVWLKKCLAFVQKANKRKAKVRRFKWKYRKGAGINMGKRLKFNGIFTIITVCVKIQGNLP